MLACVTLEQYLQGGDQRRVREKAMQAAGRLPPGQSLTLQWPVLHEGPVPEFERATWDFKVGGLVESPLVLDFAAVEALPRAEVTSDFHCVTRWSTFDNRWGGVPFQEILRRVRPRPEATHVMAVGQKGRERYGYTTNIPLADLDRPDVLLVMTHDGKALTPEHGGPLRLVVPHLYAWKSAKWLRGFIFMEADKAGYWERLGYHMYGDPFREQRFGDAP
jgi:DMSO/TMAO reductase YedYZ molybdopterin-dependent catalytic subunit